VLKINCDVTQACAAAGSTGGRGPAAATVLFRSR
jgi:hypothetical protein